MTSEAADRLDQKVGVTGVASCDFTLLGGVRGGGDGAPSGKWMSKARVAGFLPGKGPRAARSGQVFQAAKRAWSRRCIAARSNVGDYCPPIPALRAAGVRPSWFSCHVRTILSFSYLTGLAKIRLRLFLIK